MTEQKRHQDPTRIDLGWGVVAENAIHGKEHLLLVVPLEQLPNAKGRLETNPEKWTISGGDLKSGYVSTTKTNSTITAEYLKRDANRIIPPQLQKGERVQLWRFEHDGTYYWEPLNMDMHHRVQEIVVHAYAAKKKDVNRRVEETTPDNSYSRTYDTVNQLIETRQSKANGEKRAWVTQMNAKEGRYVVSDQEGNYIEINGVKNTITLVNENKSKVTLSKENITIECLDTITLKAKKNIHMECKTFDIKAETMSWDISGSYTAKVGKQVSIKCPTINLEGNVNLGSLNVGGCGGGNGNGSIKGSLSVTGPLSTSSSLSAQGSVSFPAGGFLAGYD